MWSTPVMDLVTSHESDSGDKAIPAPRKRGLKCGKLRTANTSILHKVLWLHEVIYAFDAIWLEQLEQGRVTWMDEEVKLKYK